jgi:hypothetical protein
MHPIILIPLDGVHPDALTMARGPLLTSLRERGASTLRTLSAMSRMIIPCNSSIFHSNPRLETVLQKIFYPQYFDPICGQFTIMLSDPQKWTPRTNE